MRIIPPKSFLFEAGERAVLLLHGFTGHTADVRMIGRYLERKGYTCHAPLFKGHGASPEELVKTTPDDWWQDVLEGYRLLNNKGYRKIAVCGLSLGGVLSLKLGYTEQIKGMIPMCAPVSTVDEKILYKGIMDYAKEYKKQEGKSDEQIQSELRNLKSKSTNLIHLFRLLIAEVRINLEKITAPIFIVQARNDQVVHPENAKMIFDKVQSEQKRIKWYEQSGHVVTIDQQRNELEEDIYQFLQQLKW